MNHIFLTQHNGWHWLAVTINGRTYLITRKGRIGDLIWA